MIRRLLIAFSCLIVLGLLASWGLRAISRQWVFGGDTEADLKRVAASGQPIVQAIYSYRTANGLWPQQLTDLVPAYLPTPPGSQWEFAWTHLGDNRIQTNSPGGTLRIGFCFTDQSNQGWTAGNRETEISLGMPAPNSIPPNVFDSAIATARISELRRRAAREPAELIHRQALLTDVVNLNTQDARDISKQATIDFPAHWWPHYTLAEMLVLTEDLHSADDQLVNWAEANPSFVRYWILVQFRERHQLHKEAMVALEKAIQFPIRSTDGVDFTSEYIAFLSARAAYNQGRHDLVLAVCNLWKQASGYGEPEPSWRAFQSAAYLAMGNFVAAKPPIDDLISIAKTKGVWAGDLENLQKAVDSKNQAFSYNAGGFFFKLDYRIQYK